jgi:hypothetical protein
LSPDRRQKVKPPKQFVDFHVFERVEFPKLVDWREPSLSKAVPTQLGNIALQLESLGCKTVAVEDHYIDRDYMEDHATFYSKSFCSYPNHCLRAHFFTADKPDVESKISELVQNARQKGVAQFRVDCADFSKNHYLGFMVVKPLPGCPVGRTVLRGPTEAHDFTVHSSLRLYRVHFAGIELQVHGLAFQQQDSGVSACATTAIWSAFQKVRDFEEVAAASPAHITMLAARYSLPFGRAMPSEGLSTDQMCVAVQALGASPHLLRATDSATARRYLYSILRSGMSCILIMRKYLNKTAYHAVSVAGMKCRRPDLSSNSAWEDLSQALTTLYIHDDRLGPYMRARLEVEGEQKLHLQYERDGESVAGERWELVQILLPMHSKVSLSIAELWEIGRLHLLPRAKSICSQLIGLAPTEGIQFEIRVMRAQSYLEELLHGTYDLGGEMVQRMSNTVAFSRYVGVIRLTTNSGGSLDVVIDTTSTLKSPIFLVVVLLNALEKGKELARELAAKLNCLPIMPE